MSRFSIGFAPASSIQNGTRIRAHVEARVNANAPRRLPYARGYIAVVGFLALVAAVSMFAALWRLFHFAR